MKITEFAIDADRLENGDWVDDIPDIPGLRLKVRGTFNTDWRKRQQKLVEAIPRKKKQGGRIDPEESEKVITNCLLHCCLLDWEGVEDKDGKPIPYSKEWAARFLTEPAFRRFREGVMHAANVVADIKDEDVEEAVGNLVKLSVGTTDGERKSKAQQS